MRADVAKFWLLKIKISNKQKYKKVKTPLYLYKGEFLMVKDIF